MQLSLIIADIWETIFRYTIGVKNLNAIFAVVNQNVSHVCTSIIIKDMQLSCNEIKPQFYCNVTSHVLRSILIKEIHKHNH